MAQTALLILCAALAGLAACGLYGGERVWEKRKSAVVALGELATVRAPEDLRHRPIESQPDGDRETFRFERVYKHHINGQTSLAEQLSITVFAEDAPFATGDGRWGWDVVAETYERHPVTEPAWRIRLLDREAKTTLDWRGFQKEYSVETAKRNLLFLAQSITVRERKQFFQARRDWPTDGWKENYTRNIARVGGELRALGMPPAVVSEWVQFGDLRYTIDRERPQHLVLATLLGTEPKPNYPVDFHGPVTKYTFVDGRVWQDNQGSGGGMLADSELQRLRREWREHGNVYYYSIQTLNLWGADGAGVEELLARARQLQAQHRAGTLVVEAPLR